MTQFEAFQLYMALRQHFTTDSYDFVKYNGKVKVTVDHYDRRKDCHFFQKLARLHDPKARIVSCLVDNIKWIQGMLSAEGIQAEASHQKVVSTLSYTFKNELNTLPASLKEVLQFREKEQYPLLLQRLFTGSISLETVVVLNQLLAFTPKWDHMLKDDLLWPEYKRKIVKYSPFIIADKAKFSQITLARFYESDDK